MPRSARLDAPGVIHHVIIRDIRDVLNLQTYLSISEYLFAFASLSPVLPLGISEK